MARGGMPMRPTGGGRAAQPARRPAQQRQPAKQKQPQQRGATPAQQREAQQRLVIQQQRSAERQAARANQQRVRQQIYLREAHGERQEAEALRRTEEVREQVARLESILPDGLLRSPRLDLDALRRPVDAPPFDPGPLAQPAPEPTWEQFSPGFLTGRLGSRGWKERREAEAREEFEQARAQWEREEAERKERLAEAERTHAEVLAAKRKDVEEYYDRIARVAAGLRDREPAAVESFLRTVLRRVPLPAGFPRRATVTHHRDNERVEVTMVLPGREVVPEISGYEYAAGPDEIRPLSHSEAEAVELYLRVVAQVVLLVIRDILEAESRLASVTLHGLVADGEPPEPVHLVTLHASRADFAELDLAADAPEECLKRLKAQFIADPYGSRPGVTATGS